MLFYILHRFFYLVLQIIFRVCCISKTHFKNENTKAWVNGGIARCLKCLKSSSLWMIFIVEVMHPYQTQKICLPRTFCIVTLQQNILMKFTLKFTHDPMLFLYWVPSRWSRSCYCYYFSVPQRFEKEVQHKISSVVKPAALKNQQFL